MKKVILEESPNIVRLSDISQTKPIFGKQDGKIRGMLIEEPMGWILRFPGGGGATGTHATRGKCIKSCLIHGYEFFTE